MGALNGSRVKGCVSGDYTRSPSTSTRIQVRSGDLKKGKEVAHPLAGFSLWFGNQTGVSSGYPIATTVSMAMFALPVGKPIFGVVINSEPGATVKSFTGYMVLINYQAGATQIVRYVNQNLRTDTPAILRTSSVMPDSQFGTAGVTIHVENVPSINFFQVYFQNKTTFASTVIWDTTTPYSPASQVVTGAGIAWVGNPTPGVHSVELGYGSDQQGWAFSN